MPDDFSRILYLGRSRLHRNRANLVQTLHTVAALRRLGVPMELWLPPWRRSVGLGERLDEFGVDPELAARSRQWLHSRWPDWLPVRAYRRALLRARDVYVRSPALSAVLSEAGIRHSLEVHAVREMRDSGDLPVVVRNHRSGVIDRLVPISATAATMLAEAGAEPTRMHVAPSGVDLAAFAGIGRFRGLSAVPNVLYAGRISESRGAHVIVELAARGLLRATLVGETEGRVPEHPSVTRLGHVPHKRVPALYRDVDLVLLPYQAHLNHADAISPIKLFEAMAAGRPIIASDLPAIRDVLRNEETALLVPPDDIGAWLDAIGRLHREPGLAASLAENAGRAARAYSWDARARGIAKALGWLAESPRPGTDRDDQGSIDP